MNTSGGLAPLAEALAAKGRGQDSMLVHMTPEEVGGLHTLALAHGGSLTVNPDTGLTEAGFLSSILPVLAGGLLTMTGIGAPLAAALVAGGTGIATGDLGKGLMAGLGAFGGASLAGGLGLGAASGGGGGLGGLGDKISGLFGGGAEATGAAIPGAGTGVAQSALGAPGTMVPVGVPGAAPVAASTVPGAAAAAPTFGQGFVGTAQGIPLAERAALGTGTELLGNAGWGTGLAGMGIFGSIADATQGGRTREERETPPYEGPYTPTARTVSYPTMRDANDTSEYRYFNPTNPVPGYQPGRFAAGGEALDDGAFVMDARSVSEIGDGSSGAGQEVLAGLGGIPIHGPGTGTSDTIRANIGGTQEARVSRDEVKFDPAAVARIGGGDHNRGTQKLYSLMEKARTSRRDARRGQSSGLGGLA